MTIRTPEDEVDKPGYFYPPFREGWNYQGATYAGHSDFSVDFNRRTPSGGWIEDTGDPVLAAADGTVAEVDKGDGLVILNHWNGTYRTEYRHMTDIPVKVGDKVQRGDRVGSIGNVAGDGRSFGAHLHHVHYRKVNGVWKRIQMRFEDKPVATSVGDSDTRPESWAPPKAVNIEGPPPKATWQSAYREAAKALDKVTEARDGWKAQAVVLKEERDAARSDLAKATERIGLLEAELAACADAGDCTAAVHTAVNETVDGITASLARWRRGVVV